RFSHTENTPGLLIGMQIGTGFNVHLSPRNQPAQQARLAVRTGSSFLDFRFTARTDHPTQARLLFGNHQVLASLEKLCPSTQSAFAIDGDKIEVSTQEIPAYSAHRVFESLPSLEVVARAIKQIPGSRPIEAKTVRREPA